MGGSNFLANGHSFDFLLHCVYDYIQHELKQRS